MARLPIHDFENDIVKSLTHGNRLILAAPTGSGKSTQVPRMALRAAGDSGKIIVLQPRRIAARMLATRVAAESGTRLGDDIGFRTRYESRSTQATRVLYVTEGILPRMMLSDPDLSDISTVVLDEFHERSVNIDMCLGLIRRLQESSRVDLRLVVMSATLDVDLLSDYLKDATVLTCPGRSYPINISYESVKPKRPVWERAARILQSVIQSGVEGDILVFMPGAAEIHRTIRASRDLKLSESVSFLPLFGNLAAAEQDKVMAPSDIRKVVVATNIAETSLTIPGVRCVIDSGLARIHRFEPHRGINTLELEPICRASSDQRAGRAGREAPGRCVRMWSEAEHRRRPEHMDPEVCRIDLAEVLLFLRCMQYDKNHSFPWIQSPDESAVAAAEAVLHRIDALDARSGSVTDLGRKISAFPMHPRLARLLIEAGEGGCVETAATIAAVISERPFVANDPKSQRTFAKQFAQSKTSNAFSEENSADSDFFVLIDALNFARDCRFETNTCRKYAINAGAAREVWRASDYYVKAAGRQGLSTGFDSRDADALIHAILAAYPDHLARRRDKGSLICELADGRRGELRGNSVVRGSELLVAVDIRQHTRAGEGRRVELSLASEVQAEWLIDLFPDAWEFSKNIVWNERVGAVELHSIDKCLGLVIQEQHSADVDPVEAGKVLANAVLADITSLRAWNADVKSWIKRVRCVAEWYSDKGLPKYSDTEIREVVENWCYGHRRIKDIDDIPLLPHLRARLSREQQQFVETMAPSFLVLPSGRKMRLRYAPGKPPRGNAKIQDLYGLTTTPTVAGGTRPVLLDILAPNMRPVQVTDDLAGFWETLYPEVKKTLSRRYPKHEWR